MENLNLNLPPFYPSQRVIAVEDHNQKLFKKGQEFLVLSIRKDCCYWSVDIGIRDNNKFNKARCILCGQREEIISGVLWFSCKSFAPIEERFISFADVIAKESPLTCVN